ncbi:ABC transporter permease [Paenibacillus hexagrammi]|uniref:ABC transporter permease n=1 Tax=Paenibacillus hexagrammi TaxID=2908839 RepID=A0ABY3SI08_9BACL|nr:ABC transporter permease [Paenibacillus sp. YPD9-1]UJF33133.1 ABC transporter permease [Paenibacillus sp. YPD9-1]
MKDMRMSVEDIWRQRFHLYMKETMGYWLYAARSNFVGFMLFLVIVASYYYAKTLQQLPTNYPYLWIVLLLLVPTLSASPIRTLLRDADRMFLLRMESQMGSYFRHSILYSLALQTLWLLAAIAALWPLYHHCEGTAAQPFILMLLLLIVVKLAHLLASWHESRIVYANRRNAFILFRWGGSVAIVILQFQVHLMWAGCAALLLLGIWLICLRRTLRYYIGWDYLIAREKQQQAQLYLFFNWFIHVPQLPTKISRRSWISGITRMLPFRQNSAYLYLFTKTLLRTELFGIILRMTGLGIVILCAASSPWARAIALIIIVLVSMIQLTGIERAHQYTFWLDMYPLDRMKKAGATAWLIWTVLLIQTCLLSIPLLIRSSVVYALLPAAVVIIITFICGVVLRRKFRTALLEP